MSWQPLDCHAHTTLSDGLLSPEQLVERVRARGVRPSISDHVSAEVTLAVGSVDETREYIETIEAFDVGRSAEFCWQDSLWRDLPDELTARFTHRIGSLHAIQLPGGAWIHAFASAYPQGLAVAAYMDAFIDNAERLAREMPVDILAHPTLLNMGLRRLPVDALWTEAIEERLVNALHDAGIAFEISSRYRPHERLVRRAVDRGVRISLGSDGHREDQVGDIAFSLELARALGVPDSALYDPAVHGRR
jgi:histidinol phosphatase-like PHP family hydrolase